MGNQSAVSGFDETTGRMLFAAMRYSINYTRFTRADDCLEASVYERRPSKFPMEARRSRTTFRSPCARFETASIILHFGYGAATLSRRRSRRKKK